MTPDNLVQISTSGAMRQIAVNGELTVYTVAGIHKRLLEQLPLPAETRLDLSGVTEIDTAGLQLIVALQREAVSRGRNLKIVAQSPAMQSLTELFRFDFVAGVGGSTSA